MMLRCVLLLLVLAGLAPARQLAAASDAPPEVAASDARYIAYWQKEWPRTDFSRALVPFTEILHGGPPRDGIPAIDAPRFVDLAEAARRLDPREPVIGLVIGDVARAYPLSILLWHEIVNDSIAGVPVAVTYCPLCNAAIVFERRAADGRVLDFGTTGRLRHSDLVMYDRQTESWWQQFEGRAIIGELAGERLAVVPSRLESFALFAARAPAGQVLAPDGDSGRDYGRNPYEGYDSAAVPFLFRGSLPDGIAPLARVVALGARGAWSLDLVRQAGVIVLDDGTEIRWTPGQASALDSARVADGRDVGNVTVTRLQDGRAVDVAHGIDFAFAWRAFHPQAPLVTTREGLTAAGVR